MDDIRYALGMFNLRLVSFKLIEDASCNAGYNK